MKVFPRSCAKKSVLFCSKALEWNEKDAGVQSCPFQDGFLTFLCLWRKERRRSWKRKGLFIPILPHLCFQTRDGRETSLRESWGGSGLEKEGTGIFLLPGQLNKFNKARGFWKEYFFLENNSLAAMTKIHKEAKDAAH